MGFIQIDLVLYIYNTFLGFGNLGISIELCDKFD